ncbi:hypothetical protein C9426_28610 [Serratia sp. S1B]|nr:hypothetical protein C9426_28610 [Serratia sp. S1B]
MNQQVHIILDGAGYHRSERVKSSIFAGVSFVFVTGLQSLWLIVVFSLCFPPCWLPALSLLMTLVIP